MRTVIVNTLGSELRQTPLFYLPFRREAFQWLEADLTKIESAAENIYTYSNEQNENQDYRLVVLVSLACYKNARYAEVRNVCRDLLFMHISNKLVKLLSEGYRHPPTGVSVLFVATELCDGDGGISKDKCYDLLLGFDETSDKIDSLKLVDDKGSDLDFSDYFIDALQDYSVSAANEAEFGENESNNKALIAFRSKLKSLLESRQCCKYQAPGEDRLREIPAEKIYFCPKTLNWDLIAIDLQINLSDNIANSISDGVWKMQIQAHDEKVITNRISLATQRVKFLKGKAAQLGYYSDERINDNMDADVLPNRIWKELQTNTDLPGVQELKKIMGAEFTPEINVKEKAFVPVEKIRKTWFRVIREKKNFEACCQILDDQYNAETSEKQQLTVLNTCAEIFGDWRVRMLSRPHDLPKESFETKMPEFDMELYLKELIENQKEYGKVSVDKLDDYDDLREEAEKIKADFRRDSRFWSSDSTTPSFRFWQYSVILAVVFLLQMILPYIGISLSQASFSGYVHFFTSTAIFASLYLIGVLVWLRSMCRCLKRHTNKMYDLLQKSHIRRRISIFNAINSYGEKLPKCVIKYDELLWKQRIYKENLLRKTHFHTHMRLLDKAEELLFEMHTSLRLSVNNRQDDANEKLINGEIDYQHAPNDIENMTYYMFLSEKWGTKL